MNVWMYVQFTIVNKHATAKIFQSGIETRVSWEEAETRLLPRKRKT